MRWLQALGFGVALGLSAASGCVPKDFTFTEPEGSASASSGAGSGSGGSTSSSSSSGGGAGSSSSASASASSSASASASSGEGASSSSSGAGGASCGDGFVTPPEQCDDGDTEDGNGCSSDCRCGDGAGGTVAFVDMGTGHCYAAFGDMTSWEEAVMLCAAQGGYLATLTSKEEIELVSKYTTAFDQPWLGANDRMNEGEWYWDNGEPWLMAPCTTEPTCDPMLNLWDINEPNDSGMNEDCGVLRATLSALNDESCALPFPRICERSP